MQTVTVSMRVPKSEAGRLEKLAQALGMERPVFLKSALRRGAKDLAFEGACQAYRAGEVTLSRAAELADLSLRDMIVRLRDAELVLNYDTSALDRDLQE